MMTSAGALGETPFPACIQAEPCRATPKQCESLGPQLPLGVEVGPSWQQEELSLFPVIWGVAYIQGRETNSLLLYPCHRPTLPLFCVYVAHVGGQLR